MFFLLPRATVVLGIVFAILLLKRLYAQWRRRIGGDQRPVPPIPARITGGARRSWVVFTTPYCATCGPVSEALSAHDPRANVVRIDATVESELASALRVKAAPTVFLANKRGEVQHRLVGPEAVTRYIRTR